MNHNLTEKQVDVLVWIVGQIRAGNLKEEFAFYWTYDGPVISGYEGDKENIPDINRGVLDALSQEGAIRCSPTMRESKSGQTSEASRSCVLTKKAFDIVDISSISIAGFWGRIRKLLPLSSDKVLGWVAGIVGSVIAGLILYYLTLMW